MHRALFVVLLGSVLSGLSAWPAVAAPNFVVFEPIAHGQKRVLLSLALTPDGFYTGPAAANAVETVGIDASLSFAYALTRHLQWQVALPLHGLIADHVQLAQPLELGELKTEAEYRSTESGGRQWRSRLGLAAARDRRPSLKAGLSLSTIRDPISLSVGVQADDIGPLVAYTLSAGVDLLANDVIAMGASVAWTLPHDGLYSVALDFAVRHDPGSGPFWSVGAGMTTSGGRTVPRVAASQGWRF